MDYKQLWNHGGYGKDNPLVKTIAFIQKKATEFGTPGLANLAINRIFIEVANGKQYPLDKCPCGCGIDKSGTAITHAMLTELIRLNNKTKTKGIATYQKQTLWRRMINAFHSKGLIPPVGKGNL